MLEVLDGHERHHGPIGIQTTGETRSMADDRAIGQLQHRLRDEPFNSYRAADVVSRLLSNSNQFRSGDLTMSAKTVGTRPRVSAFRAIGRSRNGRILGPVFVD